MIVLLMGVSGSGKNTLGEPLARRLGWRFIDGDDYHPPESVKKMAAGIPLHDEDRWPWLDRLNAILRGEKDAVLACSALKEAYRLRLLAGVAECEVIHLRGSFELIRERLAQRRHRYMPASLLQSQFDALEPPLRALELDVALAPEVNVARIVERLGPRLTSRLISRT